MSGAERVRVGAKRSGAWLARYALEQLPITHTFGIPGVHTTELYDELSRSEKIQPVLVTHEGGGAFMADAVSRSCAGAIGTLLIVPAAGLTHAMSGIGEAYLDGIPMLVISGGIDTERKAAFQLHDIDQQRLIAGISKGAWKVTRHQAIVPTIYQAYHTAIRGTPGPVLVELPVNLQLFEGEVDSVPAFSPEPPPPAPEDAALEEAVELLVRAKAPGLFVGWGAVDATESTRRIAHLLGAPVATTLQGLSAFPGDDPLHAGMGFSRAAVLAAERAFEHCDCLLAIGTRFAEIPTGSFGCKVPEDLIHVDIDPGVFHRNYPAKVALAGDARVILPRLLARLEARRVDAADRRERVQRQLAEDKAAYRQEWAAHRTDRVNPALFFQELRRQLTDDAITVLDDGNHTFLAAELYEVRRPRTFLSPTDFNCMGYCVPAVIGAKLANPGRQVVGVVGDGAFLMTGLEIVTAAGLGLGVVYFVFSDGELSQISQGQEIPYNRKTCTRLPPFQLEGVAVATGAAYVALEDDAQLEPRIREALQVASGGRPVIVDVRIDYSKRTRFTQGVVQTVLRRFPLREKLRFAGRAMVRKVTG